jgi:hypothetical protein
VAPPLQQPTTGCPPGADPCGSSVDGPSAQPRRP